MYALKFLLFSSKLLRVLLRVKNFQPYTIYI
jgi:hypothetical protein